METEEGIDREKLWPRLRRLLGGNVLVRITNLGLGFVLTTLVVAVGATNTGNNGLYILLAILLGVLVVSGVVSRQNVEGLDVRIEGPDEVYAGEPVRFTLFLENGSRFGKHALLAKISGRDAPLLFAHAAGREEVSRGVDLVFPRRGRHRIESLLVLSSYPIGLFKKGRVHPLGETRLVYPRPHLPRQLRPDSGSQADLGVSRSRRGRAPDVLRLREAEAGDDPRDIHWPQTARQGRFILKERSSEEGREAVVILEGEPRAVHGAGEDESWEDAVSEAAGLVLRLLSQGDQVGLLCSSGYIPPSGGLHQRRGALELLALASRGPLSAVPELPRGSALYRIRPEGRGGA